VGTVTTFAIMLVLWASLNLMALAVGTLVGQLVGVLILLIATARASAAPHLTLRSKGLEFGAFLRHAAPLTLSSAILQVNVVFDRAIASLLAPGGVSALRYAEVLVRTPISAISPAWGSAIYPTLVRAARDRDSSLASTTSRSLRFAIAVFVPIAALTAAVAPVAVAVAYGRGAFGPEDVQQTAHVVAAFAPLIVILMTSPVLAGAHNARRSGTVLLAGGIINVIFNVTLDVLFGLWIGVAGIALSSAVASTIVVTFFAWRLSRDDRAFDLRPIGRVLGLALAASVVPAVIVAAIAWSGAIPTNLIVELVALALFGVLGLGAFVLASRLVGLEEPMVLVRAVRGVVDRRRAVGAA
jgi:putative peptidoglycan lipid II flippase